MQLFKDFLEQELQNYEGKVATGEIVEAPEKVIQEMVKPDVVKIGERFYFISGPDQVFMMLREDDAHASDFAKKLDADEISNLPVDIVYLAKGRRQKKKLIVSMEFSMEGYPPPPLPPSRGK